MTATWFASSPASSRARSHFLLGPTVVKLVRVLDVLVAVILTVAFIVVTVVLVAIIAGVALILVAVISVAVLIGR